MKFVIIAFFAVLVFSASAQQNSYRTDTLHVSGNCNSCKKKIESPFKDAKGIESASWDKKTKLFVVRYDEASISLNAIKEKIAAQGYDAEGLVASPETYAKLPKCCKYRDVKCHD